LLRYAFGVLAAFNVKNDRRELIDRLLGKNSQAEIGVPKISQKQRARYSSGYPDHSAQTCSSNTNGSMRKRFSASA
jgi:hypothetical protein